MENKIENLATKETLNNFEQSLTKTIYLTTLIQTLVIIAVFAVIFVFLR